jgi:hypothetical protein
MAQAKIGKLPARYAFLLNPYTDVRLSRCPRCDRLAHVRKFALFIHVEGWGPVILGKTCRYCTPCELIMAHRDELEAELAQSPAQLTPGAAASRYFVLGTVERKVWQRGLQASGTSLEEILAHTADFKKQLELQVEPGGWCAARQG